MAKSKRLTLRQRFELQKLIASGQDSVAANLLDTGEYTPSRFDVDPEIPGAGGSGFDAKGEQAWHKNAISKAKGQAEKARLEGPNLEMKLRKGRAATMKSAGAHHPLDAASKASPEVEAAFLKHVMGRAGGAGTKGALAPLLKFLKGGAKSAVGLGAGGLAVGLGAEFLPGMTRGLMDDFGRGSKGLLGPSAEDEYLQRERDIDLASQVVQQRAQRLEQLKAHNTQLIMAANPHMAMELMAGRELPQQSTVIGGRKRTDLMDQVAGRLSQGQYGA